MKTIKTSHYLTLSNKYPESETKPYNPWAVCNKSTGGKKKSPENFEKCVNHVKEQNIESNDDSGLDKTKSVRPGRTRNYRINESPDDIFDQKLNDEISGKGQKDRDDEMEDKWQRLVEKSKKQEPVMACVISAKKKNIK